MKSWKFMLFLFRRWLLWGMVVLLLPAPTTWGQGLTFPFTLEITNLRNREGQLCLAVFRTAEGFPDQAERAALQNCLPLPPPEQPVRFTLELPYSNYAIAVFHDENLNGQLDTGAFGIPREGFGFSNNPPVRFGPPSFMDSRVLFTPQLTGTTMEMRYF